MVVVADTTTNRRSGNPIGPDTRLLSDGILLPFPSVSFDDTVNLTSSAAPFHTIRIFALPRARGITLVECTIVPHTPPMAPLSDRDLTHRDSLAAIDLQASSSSQHDGPSSQTCPPRLGQISKSMLCIIIHNTDLDGC